jgi:hypothetical protein
MGVKLRTVWRDSQSLAQLDTLTKAICTKGYSEEEKKQLYLLLLGYLDIGASVFELLNSHAPFKLAKDEELEETKGRFQRVRNYARLNVEGVSGLLALV